MPTTAETDVAFSKWFFFKFPESNPTQTKATKMDDLLISIEFGAWEVRVCHMGYSVASFFMLLLRTATVQKLQFDFR